MLKKTAKQLVEEAMTEVTTYTVEQARALHGHPGVQFVDIQDGASLAANENDGIVFILGTVLSF